MPCIIDSGRGCERTTWISGRSRSRRRLWPWPWLSATTTSIAPASNAASAAAATLSVIQRRADCHSMPSGNWCSRETTPAIPSMSAEMKILIGAVRAQGPSLQRHAGELLAAEEVDLVADDVLAHRRVGLGVREQETADVLLEDLLHPAIEPRALRRVRDRVRLGEEIGIFVIAPAGAVVAGLRRLAAPARGQDLARIGVVPGVAEHRDLMLALAGALQVLAPFERGDLGLDPDLRPVGLDELCRAPSVRHVGAGDRDRPERRLEAVRKPGRGEKLLRLGGIVGPRLDRHRIDRERAEKRRLG